MANDGFSVGDFAVNLILSKSTGEIVFIVPAYSSVKFSIDLFQKCLVSLRNKLITGMRLIKIIIFIVVLFFSGFLSANYSALGNSSDFQKITKKGQDTVIVKILTISELVQKSTSDAVYLDKIEKSLLDSTQMADVFTLSEESKQLVRNFEQDNRNRDLNTLTFRQLQNLNSLWNFRKIKVEDQIDYISSIIDDLSEERKRISELTEFWKDYGLSNPDKDFNNFLKKRIQLINGNARKVFPGFDKQLNTLLIKLDELTNLYLVIEGRIETINKYLTDTSNNYFLLDVKPLWSHHKAFDLEVTTSNLSLYFSRFRSDQKGVFADHFGEHFILIIVFIIILSLVGKVNKNRDIPIKKAYPFLENIRLIFEKKILLSVFLTLMFSLLIYKDTVAIFMQTIMFVEIIAFLVLLNMLLSKPIMKNIMIFVSFYFLLKIVDVFSHQSYIGHLILLLLNIGFLYWLYKTGIKKYVLSGLGKSKNSKLTIVIYINTIFFLIIISLVTNIIGYINISYYLISACISFTLFAMIAFFWYATMNNMLYIYLNVEKKKNFKLLYSEREVVYKYVSRILYLFFISLLVYSLITILAIKIIVISSFWEIMDSPIEIGSVSFTLSNIALFLIIIWVSMILARFIQTILREDILVRAKFDRGLPATVSMLVRYAIITFGFFVAVRAMGFELSQLTIIFGALSVGIGFGLQSIFNNLVSGLILIFERPIHIDDTIEVNNMVGLVRSIGIRTSNIRTLDGAEVLIPNGLLISNEVINWTLSDKKRRIEVRVGVAYGSDVKKVTELLYEVLKEHKEAIHNPPPMVVFDEFGDSSLNFRALFWTDNYGEWLRIRSEILFAVNDILEKENIVIPFPQRDVHMIPNKENQ